MTELLAQDGGSNVVAYVAVVVSVIAVVVSAYSAFAQRRHSAALEISTAAFEDSVDQLNNFYGPLQAALLKLLDLKSVILVTLNKKPVDQNDRAGEPRLLDIVDDIVNEPTANSIVQRLIETQRATQKDILVKAGYIRNPELRKAVRTLNRHFEGFQVAFEQRKPDTLDRFERFPRELDSLLEKEIEKLTQSIEKHRKRADDYIEAHWSKEI